MKRRFVLLALLPMLPMLAMAEAPKEYVNFVRQIQADSGVEWDVSVAPSGKMLSTEGVGPGGSHFQLWSIHSLTASDFLLDEEFVSAYSPEGRIRIITGDPDDVLPRTRCDQPFQVVVRVNGLRSHSDGRPGIPMAASNVHLGHEVVRYDPVTHDMPADPQGVERISGYISQNGALRLDYPATNLSGPDFTRLEGEEVFTISALADHGVAEAVLDSAKVQIWPIADAEISGIDPAREYADIPSVKVSLRKLYPDSTTWVRIYSGPPAPDPRDGRIVQSSYVRIEDRVPQERTVTLDDLNDYVAGGGTFTIEVLHETPFGIDILRQAPVNVARPLTVRGTLFSHAE